MGKVKGAFLLVAAGTVLAACGPTDIDDTTHSSSSSLSSHSQEESASSSESSPVGSSSSESSALSSSSSSSQGDSLGEALATAVSSSNKVKSGKSVYTSISEGYAETVTTTYEYGLDSFHFEEADSDGESIDHYLVYDGESNIVEYQIDARGNVGRGYGTYDDKMGLYISNFIGYGIYFYGAEDLLSGLYEIGKENGNGDYVESVEDGVYSFSFGYLQNGYAFYDIDVSFELGEDGILSSLSASSGLYDFGSFTADMATGFVRPLSPNPDSSVSYDISQASGERTFEAPYDLDDFMATSFDLVYEGKTLSDGDTIDGMVGSSIAIDIDNVLPTTASFDFDRPIVECDDPTIYVYYSTYDRSVNGYFSKTGEYSLSVTTAKVKKTINIKIAEAKPQTISATYYESGANGYDFGLLPPVKTAYVNTPLYIRGSITPYQADQDYVVSIKGNEEDYQMVATQITASGSYATDVTQLIFKKAGSYEITVSSKEYPEVKTVSTIEVKERLSASEVFSGLYGYKTLAGNNVRYGIEFFPSGDGLSGTAVLSDNDSSSPKKENVSYEAKERPAGGYDVSFEHVSGDELNWEIAIGPNYGMALFAGSMSYDMIKATPAFYLSGTWNGDAADGTHIAISFNYGGTVSFLASNPQAGIGKYIECLFTIDGDAESGYEITLVETSQTNNSDGYLNFEDKISMKPDYSELEMNVYISGSPEKIVLTPGTAN